MSNITFDVREISDRPAGVGRIISSLIGAMQAINPNREFILLGSSIKAPLGLKDKYYNLGTNGPYWHLKCALMLKKNPQWGTFISARSPLVPIMLPERSVYFVNDLISFRYPEYFTLKTRMIETLFTKIALKRVEKIIAISHSTARDIERLCPGANKRTTVVHLAADSIFRKIVPNLSILKKHDLPAKYILMVGTVEPRKNHLGLLAAYNGLPTKIKDQYGLVIVGKKGWKCGHIIKMIKEGVRTGLVKYLEYIDDSELVQVYNGATLFVYPSFYEGFGLPVLEAMSCGVPVIASNTSSIPEIVGEAAVLVDPLDNINISQSMLDLIINDKLREELSARCIEQNNRFSWNNSAKVIMSLI